MSGDSELERLDPVDLMEREATRIEQHLTRLPPEDWRRSSRCKGWTVRDLLAHLAASEDYHHACLDGRVSEFMHEMGERGATDIASFNAIGIASLGDVPDLDLLRRWSQLNAETRHGFRERGDGEIDTSVGLYPSRWQAFHLAGELATHADDLPVPISDADREGRRDWRVRFSRFALSEEKPQLSAVNAGGGTRVVGDAIDIVVSDDDLIQAVAGRIDSSRLDADLRRLLSTMP